MLAGGGEACTDIEYLRAEAGLFGDVPSAPTLYRTLRSLDPGGGGGPVGGAGGGAPSGCGRVRAPGDAAAPVVLDIDATLVEVHSEHKEGAAAHFKGGYGFHPLLCFSDDGDALAVVLRPGNARRQQHRRPCRPLRRRHQSAAGGGSPPGTGQATTPTW